MSELIQRLRSVPAGVADIPLHRAAADEIERLTAVNADMLTALQKTIADIESVDAEQRLDVFELETLSAIRDAIAKAKGLSAPQSEDRAE